VLAHLILINNWTGDINAYQKATLLLSLVALPLALLFMNGMNYRGIVTAGLLGTATSAALIYGLRTKLTRAPQATNGRGS
jgi:hypothetical protein